MKVNIPEIENILHELKASTDTSLRAVQRSVVPHYHDLKLVRVLRYIHDEITYKSKCLLYRVDNISYIKDLDKSMMFDCNLLEAIENNYIKPFILFMNGTKVKYENIRIISDSRNTYLEIDKVPKFDLIQRPKKSATNSISLTFPSIPEVLSNKVKLEAFPQSSILSIKMNGKEVSSSGTINEDIINTDNYNVVSISHTGNVDGVRLYVDEDINLFEVDSYGDECIVFPDYTTISKLEKGMEYPKGDTFLFNSKGYLIEDESRFNELGKPVCTVIRYNNILDADIIEGYSNYDGLISLNRDEEYVNSIDCIFTFSDGVLVTDIKNHGVNMYTTQPNIYYKAYYYKEFKSVNNITRYSKMTDYIDHIINGDNIDHVEKILDPLDFVFDQPKLKIDRIKEVVLKICKHNPNLLQSYIDSKSRIKTEYYSKEEIIDLCDDKGDVYNYRMIRVPHGRTHGIGLMVYIDGLLYDQESVYSDDNYVYVDFDKNTLDNCDYIEFMIFYDVFNEDIKITYDMSDPEFLLSNYIPFEDIQVLTHDIYNHIYKNIPMKEELQYEIPNILTDLGKGYINLDFPDYYDGRKLFLSSRRKFIHEEYVIEDEELMIEELYKIILPDSFKYCTNKDQFVLFHNGRKISGRDAVICLNKWNLPFDKRFIHLNKKCEIGDAIDIYYVPEELAEVYFSDTIEERGYVHINYDDLGYTLDGRNSSIFVNGRRVPSDYIETVGNDHARINIDMTSRKNISVVKHIYHDDIVFQLMRSIESQWDKMIDGLSDERLDELFDFNILISDTEEDVRANLYPTHMVLYEIIRRYWIMYDYSATVDNPLFYVDEHNGQKILRIDSSIYTISVPKMIDKYVDVSDIAIYRGNIEVIPLDSINPFINSEDIDHSTITYYNPNSIVVPNDSNIFESDDENIIDIIERAIIEKRDIFKYAGSDHLRIDGTEELINTLDLVDKYFYENLKKHDFGDDSVFELDAATRFIEYRRLLETPEFKEYFKNHVTLIYVVDAAIEYLINANLGVSGDIHIDANRIFPYYWDMRIAKVISREQDLVGIPIDSSLDSIVEITNRVGDINE